MEYLRPIQCYSCFVWCNHFRNECPTKENPICSKCSQHGHSYTDCSNGFCCPNCEGPHPATARICPEYFKAIEKLKPIIAEQLAHYLVNKEKTSDNAIGTDLLRAATLASNNTNDFVTSLFNACQIFNENPSQPPSEFDLELDEPNNSRVTPEEIITKDTSLEDTAESFGTLNHEISLATKTALINLPKTNDIIPYPRAFTDSIPSYNECQYGLTNNGMELIETIKDQKTQHTICNLKSPKYKEAQPNIMYMQIAPYRNIVFFNPQNNQNFAIKPKMIDNVILCQNSVKFDTYDYGTYELIFDEQYAYTKSIVKDLSFWLKTQYDVNLITS